MGIAGDRSSDSIKDYHRTVPGYTGSNVNFFLFAINFVLCVGLEEICLSNLLKSKVLRFQLSKVVFVAFKYYIR